VPLTKELSKPPVSTSVPVCLSVVCLHVDSILWCILDCGLIQIILRFWLCMRPVLCVCECILRHDELCYMLHICVLLCLWFIDIKSVGVELPHISFSILCQSFMKLNVQHLHSGMCECYSLFFTFKAYFLSTSLHWYTFGVLLQIFFTSMAQQIVGFI